MDFDDGLAFLLKINGLGPSQWQNRKSQQRSRYA